MKTPEDIKLADYDDEDISDIILQLEKSFNIRFGVNAFIAVNNFGDFCDVIENNITAEHVENCTTQQAFYKIRNAIAEAQLLPKSTIRLDSKLEDLFPKHDRRKKVKLFQQKLGVTLAVLTFPDWIGTLSATGIILSFIGFFFSWKIALGGIVFFALMRKIASYLGKTLQVKTVRELTKKFSAEHYAESRRLTSTVNKNEVHQLIKEIFSERLDIEEKYLNRDAKFSWANDLVRS